METRQQTDIEEKIISRRRAFDGLILHIDHAEVLLPDGRKAMREIACHIGASAVLPLDAEGNVTLVRQFRTPVGRALLEIPAGKLDDPGENRLECARRELREETGLAAEEWIHLTDMASTPGFSSEIISLYLARGLSQGDTHPDEDEFLNIVKLPYSEALAMAESGRLTDSKTLCAILLARPYIEGGAT